MSDTNNTSNTNSIEKVIGKVDILLETYKQLLYDAEMGASGSDYECGACDAEVQAYAGLLDDLEDLKTSLTELREG